MNIVNIYIPYISRVTTKEDIINVFQKEYGIGSVDSVDLLTDKSNTFCDCCKWKPEHSERRSCDVCLLRSKKKQIGAYVKLKLNMENETAQLIAEAFDRNIVYNLRVTRYSDYEDRTTKIWCLTKTLIELPLKTDDSPRIEAPPNTPTNSILGESRDNVTQFDLIYSDYDSELDSKHESLASSSSCEEDSKNVLLLRSFKSPPSANLRPVMSDEDSVELKADCAFTMCNCVKQKLNEANLLLSIREKQIEELERQLKNLRDIVLAP